MDEPVIDLDMFDKVVKGDPKLGYSPEGVHSLDFQIVLSRIPPLFGISPKATYLAFRSIGMTSKECLRVLKMERTALKKWRMEDELFFHIETEKLIELQRSVGPEVVRLKFLRNALMLYEIDSDIIKEVWDKGVNEVTDKEFQYFRQIRGNYNPADLLSLEKAINPDKHREKVTIQLSWGDTPVLEEAQEADYKLLPEGVE